MRKELNLEELEWSDDAEFNIDEETLVRSTVETLQGESVDPVDVEATKVIPATDINARVSEDITPTQMQDLLDIIDAQENNETSILESSQDAEQEDLGITRVIPAASIAETLVEEDAEVGEVSPYAEKTVKPKKTGSAPKKHPGAVRSQASMNKEERKEKPKAGNGKNIKVQRKKKNAFERFILNLSWMDAVIGLTGVLAAAILVFVLVFWNNNHNKVEDLGEFTSIGMQLSDLDTIGRNGINRIVSTSGGDVIGEAFIPSEEGEEEAVMVSVSFTSIEKDLKIKFSDKTNDKLLTGVAFELEVVTPSNETLTWIDDDKDGLIYQEGLKGGAYMITIKSVGDFSFPTDPTKVMVKDKISYQVINVLDEIKTEDEINVAVEDTQDKDNIEQETLLADTVKWVPSEKKISSGEDGYALVDKTTITDPMTLTSASLGGFRKVDNFSEPAITVEAGKTATATITGSENLTEFSKYEYTWTASEGLSVVGNGRSATITAGNTQGSGTVTCTVVKTKVVTPEASEPSTDSSSETTEPTEPTPTPTPTTETVTDVHTFSVTINAPAPTGYVTGVKVEPATVEFKKGSTEGITLKATVIGEGTGFDTGVTWTSSDAKVATVDANGVVKPTADAAVGSTATITATAKGADKDGKTGTLTAKCEVKIVVAGDLSLKLNADKAEVLVGETYTIVPTVENYIKDKTVKYTVDKTEIATVDDKGVVTGVAKGTAIITVTTVENGKDSKPITATVTVTVKHNPKKDTTTLLLDASGNQVYIKDAGGKYVKAKWADYYTATEFYIEAEPTYTYYGWQTLNGKTYFFNEDGKKVTGEQVISGVKYNFASDGSLSMNGGVLGIDVSKWNGTIDWNAVKSSGISFVVIRCGYRGSSTGVLVKDPMFEANIKGATKAGLKVGLYFFSQAVNEKEAVEEASMAIALAKDYKISYPIFIDTEWTSGGRANGISKDARTAVCKAFCETIKSAGYTPGVYACKSWYQDSLNVSSLNEYKIWLAQYASQPTYSSRYDMWQYSDKGKVNGISTNVDMNISYLGY
ncbi:MAG: Ig-like domain-containing protein [Lachnospiraceae bacterium]|nr:Ig-like domain-containing protein [Lachnospiraceae bacterium]